MNESHKDEIDRLIREQEVIEEQKVNLIKRLEGAEGAHCFFY